MCGISKQSGVLDFKRERGREREKGNWFVDSKFGRKSEREVWACGL